MVTLKQLQTAAKEYLQKKNKNEVPTVTFRQFQTGAYEEQIGSLLQESTFFDELYRSLDHFHLMPTFESAARELITEVSDKQLFSLVELRKQIDDSKIIEQIDDSKQEHQTSILESIAALDKSFDHCKQQQEKYRTEFVNLFLQHFSDYFKETNPLSKDLLDHLKTRIPLQLAELGIEGHAEDQLEANIQLLETHVPLTMDFKNALEVLKKAYLIDPEISHFIFIAREEAFLLLQNRIKNHFLHGNLKLAKTDYDSVHRLFSQFYREKLTSLISYYQDYKNITEVFQQKFDILDDVGEPIKDWVDRYQQLSNSTTFFSEVTSQRLKSRCDELSIFKQQIQLENPKKFLQAIKNKIQFFLETKVQLLNQEFQEHRADLLHLKSSLKLSPHEIDKLLETKQSHCLAIEKKWIGRQERLKRINNLEDLKNFKQHFPEDKLFSHSLDLEKTAFFNALTILDETTSLNEKEQLVSDFSKISEPDLIVKRIMLILESIDNEKLPDAIQNLLKFIYSENTDSKVNDTKKHIAYSLKKFFNTQSEKTAFCLAKTLDNASPLLNADIHENVFNYLRLIDVTALQRIKEKNSTDNDNTLIEDDLMDDFEKLILTKETLNLFEGNPTPKTVWDACLWFNKFYNSSPRFHSTSYPFLNTNDNIAFIKAVESLNSLLRMLSRPKKSSYCSSLFLKPNQQKQKLIENLIKDLKDTPISQVDKHYINDFFEKWRNDNEPIIKEPRYRLFVGVFMLIYKHIKKLFSHSEFETNSVQTVKELQQFFSSACEDLEHIKVAFEPFSSTLEQHFSSESEKSLTRSP